MSKEKEEPPSDLPKGWGWEASWYFKTLEEAERIGGKWFRRGGHYWGDNDRPKAGDDDE